MRAQSVIVDKNESTRSAIEKSLHDEGHTVFTFEQVEKAYEKVQSSEEIAVFIVDLGLCQKDDFKLVDLITTQRPESRVLIVSDEPSLSDALATKLLNKNIFAFFRKPIDSTRMLDRVRKAVALYNDDSQDSQRLQRLEARVRRVEGQQEDDYWFVSKSASMAKVNETMSILRRDSMRGDSQEEHVLIVGENGSGKEGIARMIHAGSRRGRGPWASINCFNLSEQFLESELFGHEESATRDPSSLRLGLLDMMAGGTLFIDNVDQMSTRLQDKIHLTFQKASFVRMGGERQVNLDVRLILGSAPTSRGPSNRLSELCPKSITLPALRDREEDIILISNEFFKRAFEKYGKTFSGFSKAVVQAFQGYSWPGNLKELLLLSERVALVHPGSTEVELGNMGLMNVESNLVPEGKFQGLGSKNSPYLPPQQAGHGGYMTMKKQWCDAFEKEYLVSSLSRHNGNVSAAAREAKIDRSNFLRLLRRHSLQATQFRKAA